MVFFFISVTNRFLIICVPLFCFYSLSLAIQLHSCSFHDDRKITNKKNLLVKVSTKLVTTGFTLNHANIISTTINRFSIQVQYAFIYFCFDLLFFTFSILLLSFHFAFSVVPTFVWYTVVRCTYLFAVILVII